MDETDYYEQFRGDISVAPDIQKLLDKFDQLFRQGYPPVKIESNYDGWHTVSIGATPSSATPFGGVERSSDSLQCAIVDAMTEYETVMRRAEEWRATVEFLNYVGY